MSGSWRNGSASTAATSGCRRQQGDRPAEPLKVEIRPGSGNLGRDRTGKIEQDLLAIEVENRCATAEVSAAGFAFRPQSISSSIVHSTW
jgi:hypothetical protein